jgi:branched-chain amino acid transport system ATP-binding protein/neutral amino acid transport system ATP-binding protein
MFPDLVPLKHVRAGDLSGGQRQMVAFGMALMLSPRILLLDEPSAGLSPLMVGQMFDTVVRVNGQGVAILMVEQNAIQGLKISHRGIVMAGGQIAMEGAASDLLESKSVSELYLGSRT